MYTCKLFRDNGFIEEVKEFATYDEALSYAKKNARIVISHGNGWEIRLSVSIYKEEEFIEIIVDKDN